jgi:hypothetical protein
MSSIKKKCPRCEGERGFWIRGIWRPCITCKTQGSVKIASMAEFRRINNMGKMTRVCSICKCTLTLRVCRSAAGFYLGFICPKDGPYERVSNYVKSEATAQYHLDNVLSLGFPPEGSGDG